MHNEIVLQGCCKRLYRRYFKRSGRARGDIGLRTVVLTDDPVGDKCTDTAAPASTGDARIIVARHILHVSAGWALNRSPVKTPLESSRAEGWTRTEYFRAMSPEGINGPFSKLFRP